MRRLCELQTMRTGTIRSRTELKNRSGSGLGDSTATKLAAATITHFTRQLEAIDRAIGETIGQDAELRGRRELLLSVIGVVETLATSLMAEMPRARGSASEWRNGRLCRAQPEPPSLRFLD